MTSPLPRQLRLGPYTWQMRNTKRAWARGIKHQPHFDAETDGFTEIKTNEIFIKPGLQHQYEQVVVLHEIMHACRASSHLNALDLNDAEESYINAVAPVLYAALHDNPDLLDYLGLT